MTTATRSILLGLLVLCICGFGAQTSASIVYAEDIELINRPGTPFFHDNDFTLTGPGIFKATLSDLGGSVFPATFRFLAGAITSVIGGINFGGVTHVEGDSKSFLFRLRPGDPLDLSFHVGGVTGGIFSSYAMVVERLPFRSDLALDVQPVPIPPALMLFGSALAGLGGIGRRAMVA